MSTKAVRDEPLVSRLPGRRVVARPVYRLTAIVSELRKIDDARGGRVLAQARDEFERSPELPDRVL